MPKLVDHEQRRREIAEATWRAIDECGADGVTMRAIAERAGCTTGRLNHYFRSQDDLLIAALQHAYRNTAARMTRAAEQHTGRDALLAVLLEALPVDDTRRGEYRVWLTFWGQAMTNGALQAEHQRRYDAWHQLLTRLVRTAAPHIPAKRAANVAESLAALADGLGVQAIMHPASARPQHLRRLLELSITQLLGDAPATTDAA
ncbi:MAG: TetR family transcriptional regulator C-terminal domain-containing protein [Actinobacteria bacterium]|nr:TetR family transcriptional regulator C-terminal domain-containing protein [Actinomycetota bacterium]